MCLRVYIASMQPLPLIPWNKDKPSLYIRPLEEQFSIERLQSIFSSEACLYEAGSFMGCGCGFTYDDWSADDPSENHELRQRDVLLLMTYLKDALVKGPVQLFCTWWQDLRDSYETMDFYLDNINEKSFDFPEDCILKVKTL